jgi:hypothetical protein
MKSSSGLNEKKNVHSRYKEIVKLDGLNCSHEAMALLLVVINIKIKISYLEGSVNH